MNVVIGCDHRGYPLKEKLKKFLNDRKVDVLDVGTSSTDSVDYPDFGSAAAEKVSTGEYERGIVICGSGIGMSMVANKLPRVRAALCHDEYTAKMSRLHNDSNILSLGADVIDEILAKKIVETWLDTAFEGGRHRRRVDKIEQFEEKL